MKWPVVLVVAAGLTVFGVWLAMRRRSYGWQGQLPYFARSFRLTELPEYQRALRAHQRVVAAALVVAIVAVTALVVAVARPTRTYQPDVAGSDTPHVDIMLCFGPLFNVQFADRNGLAPLMAALRRHVDRFENQRIGMTHQYFRAIPVTADHEWVSKRFGEIIDLAEESAQARASGDYSRAFDLEEEIFERRAGGPFANARDTLAMCAMGLPSVGRDNGRGRMIVYIGEVRSGDQGIRPPADPSAPPPLYSGDHLEKTLAVADIEVNAIVPDLAPGPIGFVEQVVRDTGGKMLAYTELDTLFGEASQLKQDNLRDELTTTVDAVLNDPPRSALDVAREHLRQPFQWDVPEILLQIALIAAVALAALRWRMKL